MPRRTLTPAPTAALAVLASIALALLTLGGCGGDKVVDPDRNGTSNLQGYFASEGNAGRLGVVIAAPASSLGPGHTASTAVVAATGSLALESGGTVSLAGTCDTAIDSLHLTGSGYEFGGRVAWVNGVPTIAGRFTSPGDDGAFGIALVNSFGPHASCGMLFLAGDSLVGRLGFVISGSEILGAACFAAESDPVMLHGALDRTTSKPRLSLTGASATRAMDLHGALDEDADLSAGSWSSTGTAGVATGTWNAALCP